jgi:hypothetical protein
MNNKRKMKKKKRARLECLTSPFYSTLYWKTYAEKSTQKKIIKGLQIKGRNKACRLIDQQREYERLLFLSGDY